MVPVITARNAVSRTTPIIHRITVETTSNQQKLTKINAIYVTDSNEYKLSTHYHTSKYSKTSLKGNSEIRSTSLLRPHTTTPVFLFYSVSTLPIETSPEFHLIKHCVVSPGLHCTLDRQYGRRKHNFNPQPKNKRYIHCYWWNRKCKASTWYLHIHQIYIVVFCFSDRVLVLAWSLKTILL